MAAMPTAIVTGASRGLGLALAHALADRGWRLVVDARDGAALEAAVAPLRHRTHVVAIAGDVGDAWHRSGLVAAAGPRIDLVVNNASDLGPSPLPTLGRLPLGALEQVLRTNLVAPLGLVQTALSQLVEGARVINVSSDAAVEPYEGWGGYGTSKAALDQLSAILAAENPGLRVYAVDPGDMRTAMHQEAFPGEDISDRPLPEQAVPALIGLVAGDHPSGRLRAAQVQEVPA